MYLEIGMERFTDQEWFKKGKDMSAIIANIYRKNVYIKKANSDEKTKATLSLTKCNIEVKE